MAKPVKVKKGQEFKFESLKGGGSESKYPWDEWFNGDLLLLERSEGQENDKGTIDQVTTKKDFEVSVNAMVPKIHTAARKRYKVVQVSRKDSDGNRLTDGLIIKARDMSPDERQEEDILRAEEKEAAKARRSKEVAGNGQAPATTQAPVDQTA